MSDEPVFVTSGVGSEYVLGELCEFLRGKSCEVCELNFANFQGDAHPVLRNLSKRNTVYISSAHTNLTRELATSGIAPWLIDSYPNYLSPLEIIPLLMPRQTMFVPHDLLSPYGEDNLSEWRFLDLYDHIFAPYRVELLESHLNSATTVHYGSWIKYSTQVAARKRTEPRRAEEPIQISVIPSFIIYLLQTYGAAGTVDYLRPVLRPGVRVKLPLWAGVEPLEKELRESTDCEIVARSFNSTELIQDSDIVICNGPSSILAEAALMGVVGICLLDDDSEPASTKREKLSGFPAIHFHDYSERAPLDDQVLNQLLAREQEAPLVPFDFETIYQLGRKLELSAS